MESELPWECAGPREASLSPVGDQSCPRIRGLFGLENTSEVMESKVPIIHSRLLPFSCLSSLPDPILPKAEQPQDATPAPKPLMEFHSSSSCAPMGGPGDGQGYPRADNDFPGSREVGNLHAGSPTPRPAGCVCNPLPQAADKGSHRGNPAQVFITGIMPQSPRPREPGKHPHPTARSRGCTRSSWEQRGETSPKTKP